MLLLALDLDGQNHFSKKSHSMVKTIQTSKISCSPTSEVVVDFPLPLNAISKTLKTGGIYKTIFIITL